MDWKPRTESTRQSGDLDTRECSAEITGGLQADAVGAGDEALGLETPDTKG